jgi:hypothetical protein
MTGDGNEPGTKRDLRLRIMLIEESKIEHRVQQRDSCEPKQYRQTGNFSRGHVLRRKDVPGDIRLSS